MLPQKNIDEPNVNNRVSSYPKGSPKGSPKATPWAPLHTPTHIYVN